MGRGTPPRLFQVRNVGSRIDETSVGISFSTDHGPDHALQPGPNKRFRE
jgi:hypothetical protein